MHEDYLKQTAILIPSLDPDEQLLHYVQGLTERNVEHIIIVDDGSRQETQHIFEQLSQYEGVTILKHAVNQGKGRALKTGINYFLNTYTEQECKGLVTADADGQHSIDDTLNVAKVLCETGGFIMGTRNFKAENVPFKSRNGNQITTFVFALLYGKKVTDTQTGLRGIPYSFLPHCLNIQGERFEYEIMMLIDAVRSHMPIVEETIDTIYINSNRATHFHAIKDSYRIYKCLLGTFLKYTVSSLLSFLIDIGIFDLITKVFLHTLPVSESTLYATIVARVISSLFNFNINKQVVFKKNGSYFKTLVKYYILCILQMLCSWGLVVLVYNRFTGDTTIIKIIVDTLLYFVSYQIQRRWVYK